MIEQEVNDVFAKDPTFNRPASTGALPTPRSEHSAKWEGQFDVVKTMQEITILTASRTLQGKEVRENLDKGYAQLYNDLDGGFTPVHMMFPYLPLESSRKRDRAQKRMSQFYMDIIRGRAENGGGMSGEEVRLLPFVDPYY
jgi:sterol 14-demethylase